jgi:hypothetical protein
VADLINLRKSGGIFSEEFASKCLATVHDPLDTGIFVNYIINFIKK